METAEYICVNVSGSLVGCYRKVAVHFSTYSRSIGEECKK